MENETTPEVNEQVAPEANLSGPDLLAELAKVRAEAAARRVENRELKAAQEELQKYKDAEKTELERVTERAAQAESRLQSLTVEKLAREAAVAAGLAPELAEFLKGTTEEELAASAEALANKTKSTAPDLGPGTRGAPVRAEKTAADAFRSLFL